MNAKACDEIVVKLVDYADGELSADEAAQVADHLAECARCREMLAALRRSLDLAGAIWQAGESDLIGVQVPARRSRMVHLRRAAIAAGVILLIAAGSLLWRHNTQSGRQDVAAGFSPTAADIELAVTRAGAATGLVAAADYLAEQPGGQEIAIERFEHVVQTYPETEAAAQATAKLRTYTEKRG